MDINNIIQLVIFICGVDENFDVLEEFLDMVFMMGIKFGNEIFLCVEKSLKKFCIDWLKLVSVVFIGILVMVDVSNGFVIKLKSRVVMFCKGVELKFFCCIIYLEFFCVQKLKMDYVMDVVVNFVNWICFWGLNYSEFIILFYELDS